LNNTVNITMHQIKLNQALSLRDLIRQQTTLCYILNYLDLRSLNNLIQSMQVVRLETILGAGTMHILPPVTTYWQNELAALVRSQDEKKTELYQLNRINYLITSNSGTMRLQQLIEEMKTTCKTNNYPSLQNAIKSRLPIYLLAIALSLTTLLILIALVDSNTINQNYLAPALITSIVCACCLPQCADRTMTYCIKKKINKWSKHSDHAEPISQAKQTLSFFTSETMSDDNDYRLLEEGHTTSRNHHTANNS
jgi:hypothetical protein